MSNIVLGPKGAAIITSTCRERPVCILPAKLYGAYFGKARKAYTPPPPTHTPALPVYEKCRARARVERRADVSPSPPTGRGMSVFSPATVYLSELHYQSIGVHYVPMFTDSVAVPQQLTIDI